MGLEINKVKYKADWTLVRLKEICNRISDGVHFTPEYVKEGVPFISVKDIYDDTVHFEKCKYITVEAHKELIKRCHPEKDDLLITKSGTIGRMALVPEKPEFSLFVSVALIKNKKDLIHSKFLKLCLENFINSINISQDIKGGLLKNFHLEDIRETLVPKVTLNEQEAIISKLEELFSELDKGIENLHTAQQQLKTYRQSVLKWAFEGKLTNENVKEGELPKGWKWVKLKDIMDKIRSGSAVPPSNVLSNYPMLRSSSVRNGRINFMDVKYIQTEDKIKADDFVIAGDLLFTRLNGSIDYVGNCAKVPQSFPDNLIYPDRLFRLRLLKPEYADYIMYFFATNIVRKEIENKAKSTAGHMRISTPDITDMMIPLCPVDENKIILQAIESRLSVADKMEESITQSLQQAEALRQSILKKAFEGRLV